MDQNVVVVASSSESIQYSVAGSAKTQTLILAATHKLTTELVDDKEYLGDSVATQRWTE